MKKIILILVRLPISAVAIHIIGKIASTLRFSIKVYARVITPKIINT